MKKYFIYNIWSILVFIIILISFLIITHTLRYDVLTDHDLAYPFGRKFLEPEHGRYIATYINFLLTDLLPEYLNFHPNDFQVTFINPLKAFCTVLIFVFLSYTPFIFSKNKFNISNPAFILCYILIFISIYNDLSSLWVTNFFYITENTVFWEYPMSLFLYFSFWLIITYYYIKDTPLPPRNLILTLCIAFFLGISVDPLICPTLLSLIFFISLILFKIIFQTKQQRKIIWENNKHFFSIFIVFFLACLIYYFGNPISLTNDHSLDYGSVTFKQYFAANFNNFIQVYCRFFFSDNSSFLVIIMILFSIIFTLKYYERQKNRRILHIIFFNIISFLLFFFSTFIIGFCYEPQNYWATFHKWTNLYLYSCCFFTLMLTGFVIDENIKLQKHSVKIKSILVLFILILFYKPLVFQYPYHIKMFEEQQKKIRCLFYNAEKFAVSQNSAEIYLPKSFKQECLIDSVQECWFLVYINAIYTYKNKKKNIVFLQDSKMDILDSEKTANVKFKTLLQKRRKIINKKFFMDNDYNK